MVLHSPVAAPFYKKWLWTRENTNFASTYSPSLKNFKEGYLMNWTHDLE